MSEHRANDDINAPRQTEQELMNRMIELYASANDRQLDSQKNSNNVFVHNIKVARQYYWLRWIIGIISIVAPLVILYVVISGIKNGDFASAHVAAQALLVSGAFISLIVLYGVILQGLFKSLQGRKSLDYSQNHPHDDLPASSKNNDDIPEDMKEFLAMLKKKMNHEESRQ